MFMKDSSSTDLNLKNQDYNNDDYIFPVKNSTTPFFSQSSKHTQNPDYGRHMKNNIL